MKILQLTKHYPPQFGGIESVTYDVTEGLNDAGIECDVMCSNLSAKTVIEQENGYKIFRVGTLLNIAATSISPRIITQLRKLQNSYDIFQLHFPNPMVALAIFLVRPQKKIIVHWHSDIIKQKNLYVLFRPLEKWILKRADVIVSTSENYLSESKALQDFRHKTIVVPLGISTDRFVSSVDDMQAVKDQYPGKKIVFSLGRLVYYKGFEYLIEAAQYLDENTVVLIGGAGELRERLHGLIIHHGLENKVKLLNRIPDEKLSGYYQACDVFCLPSTKRSEAFGVVQLEAMYFKKPIVATEIPGSGVSWVNKHNETGFNVPPQNAKALAEKINLLLNNPDLAQSFSANAADRFHKNFTRQHMIDAFVEIYTGLTAKNTLK